MENNHLKGIVGQLLPLGDRSRRELIRMLGRRLSEDDMLKWCGDFLEVVDPYSRWRSLDFWMEERFKKNPRWTPMRMAHVCLRYHKIDSRMMPKMIKIAQRVKERVAKRRRKAGREVPLGENSKG